jgi:chaperonin GroES
MAAKVRPLHNRLIVRRIDEDDTTAGGIIIPDTAKEKPQQGDVIAVGSGRRDDSGNVIKMDVQKGDRILFSKYAGTEVNLDDGEHLIITEDDVLAVLE